MSSHDWQHIGKHLRCKHCGFFKLGHSYWRWNIEDNEYLDEEPNCQPIVIQYIICEICKEYAYITADNSCSNCGCLNITTTA